MVPAAISKRVILIHELEIKNRIQLSIVSHNRVIDNILAFNGMALCSLKLRIYDPKYLCRISQLYNLGELLK